MSSFSQKANSLKGEGGGVKLLMKLLDKQEGLKK